MIRKTLPIIIALSTLLYAQDSIEIVIPANTKLSKNIIFLFDCSASMSFDGRFGTALKQLNLILNQPLDDGMFSIVTFSDGPKNVNIWPGISYDDDPKPPPKFWTRLPDAHAIKLADQFLDSISCEGNTDLFSGINASFKLSLSVDDVSLILFSDGDDTTHTLLSSNDIQNKIELLQKVRINAGLKPMPIFVIGVGENQNTYILASIAKLGNGFYATCNGICKECIKKIKSAKYFRSCQHNMH